MAESRANQEVCQNTSKSRKAKTPKHKRGSTLSVGIDTFENMGLDDKVNVLFRKISNVESTHLELKVINESVISTNKMVDELASRISANQDTITQ